jgi:hypothetical protein
MEAIQEKVGKKTSCIYSTNVKPGGINAFHDIVPGEQEFVGGVADYWRKMKEQYAVHVIVEDWGQGGFGIGWFIKPESFESESDETGN